MISSRPPRGTIIRWLTGVAAIGAACLFVGALLGTASGGSSGPVILEVPGALNVSAYCGGDDTHFADGEELSFVPETSRCDLEAPLSPQMPLRDQVVLERAGRYRCDRKGMGLDCKLVR